MARVIFAFLFLEIYIVVKVGISSKKQAAVLFRVSKPTGGEGGVKECVCSTVFSIKAVTLN